MPRRRRPHAGAARAAAAAAGAAATGAVSSPRTQNSSSSPPAAERTAPANAGVAGSSVTGTVPDGGRARASAASTRSLSRAAGSRNPSHGSVNAQRSVASSPSSATLSADSVATVRPPGRAPERAARRSRARARPETASSDGERAEDALEWGHLLPRGLVAQRLDSAGDERASAAGGGSAGVIGDRRGSAPEPLVRRREHAPAPGTASARPETQAAAAFAGRHILTPHDPLPHGVPVPVLVPRCADYRHAGGAGCAGSGSERAPAVAEFAAAQRTRTRTWTQRPPLSRALTAPTAPGWPSLQEQQAQQAQRAQQAWPLWNGYAGGMQRSHSLAELAELQVAELQVAERPGWAQPAAYRGAGGPNGARGMPGATEAEGAEGAEGVEGEEPGGAFRLNEQGIWYMDRDPRDGQRA